MDTPTIKQNLIALIAEGRTDLALRTGIVLTAEKDPAYQDFAVQTARLKRFDQEYKAGRLSAEAHEKESNKMAYAILDLIEHLPDSLFEGIKTEFWRTVYQYIPPDTPRDAWALALLQYVNHAALYLFDADDSDHVLPGSFMEWNHVWEEIFQQDEIEAQSKFTNTRVRETNEYVRQKVLRLLDGGSHKIWMIGNPGVGKTTTLYNIYLHLARLARSRATGFIPMLMQPQELNREDAIAMDLVKHDQQALFLTILKIWLAKRNIQLDDADLEIVIRQLLYHITVRGEVLVLIDSYDELSRMKTQVEIFTDLFRRTKCYLCASRPETYNEMIEEHVKVEIKSPWDIPTIREYLDQRLQVSREDVTILTGEYIRHITDFAKDEWLRNPRYINLIIRGINQYKTENSDYRNLLEYIVHGEYNFCKHLINHSIIRSLRMYKGKYDLTAALLYRKLGDIAVSQLNYGSYLLTEDKIDFQWRSVLGMTDILDYPVRDDRTGAIQVRIQNQNFVDFFLTERVANQVYAVNLKIEFTHLWSINLLTYLAEFYEEQKSKFRAEELESAITRKLDGLLLDGALTPGRYRETIPTDQETRLNGKFSAVNLIHLLVQLERTRLRRSDTPANPVFENKLFRDINLSNVELQHVVFRHCNFQGSILSFSNLEHAVFEYCNFQGCNFQHAQASNVTFTACEFDFTSAESGESPLNGMVIQNMILEDCESAYQALDEKDFLRYQAIGRKSRYSSPFGRKFLKNMGAMLGDGLKSAEKKYTSHIKQALQDLNPKQTVSMIDLMSGGSNDRLNVLFDSYKNLVVLALDRDTSNTDDLLNKVGPRFRPVCIEIAGRCMLQKLIEDNLESPDGKVDLIIGKKALHEINREAQQALLAECSEVLRPGGQLIVFADSPPIMSEAGFARLEAIKSQIYQNHEDIPTLEKLVLAPQLLSTLQAGSPDDIAIFSNLWVMLKDLANDNMHEFHSRYFSAYNELIQWAEKSGLSLVNNLVNEPDYYYLNPKLFNETGINRAGTVLEQVGQKITPDQESAVANFLIGKDRSALQLLNRFAQACLFKAGPLAELPAQETQRTALGERLEAEMRPVNFTAVDERLRFIRLPFEKGAAFRFSVHNLVFQKK